MLIRGADFGLVLIKLILIFVFCLNSESAFSFFTKTKSDKVQEQKQNPSIDTPVYFDIPKQELNFALVQFAEQANIQLVLVSSEKEFKKVGPIYGRKTIRQALNKLLGETQLKFKSTDKGTITVFHSRQTSTENTATEEVLRPSYELPSEELLQEEILIVGIRGSSAKALSDKKNSLYFEDNIYHQTIGKYPDNNAADSLQRIPGISVDRAWGESQDAFIRGTDKSLNKTVINGQPTASTYWYTRENSNIGRAFNYSLIPSEFLEAIEVVKSPSADQEEGSIGGMVNLKLKQPLNQPNKLIAYSHKQQYGTLSKSWDPKQYLTLNWINSESDFGVLLSVNDEKKHFRRDEVNIYGLDMFFTVEDQEGHIYDNVAIPWGIDSSSLTMEKEVISYHLAAQWEASNNWSILLNHLSTSVDAPYIIQNYVATPGSFAFGNKLISDYEIRTLSDNTKLLTRGTVGSANDFGHSFSYIERDSLADLKLHDLKAKYTGDSITFELATGWSDANGGTPHETRYFISGKSRVAYNLDEKNFQFNTSDIDQTRFEASRKITSASSDQSRMRNNTKHLQLDFSKQFQQTNIEIKGGLKYRSDRANNSFLSASVPFSSELQQTLEAIPSSRVASSHSIDIAPSFLSQSQFALLAPYKVNEILTPLVADTWNYELLTNLNFVVEEEIYSLYAKYNQELDLHFIDIGIRASHTIQHSETRKSDLVTASRSYNNLLPSINWRYKHSEQVYFRGSASRALSRPSFHEIGNIPTSNLPSDIPPFASSVGNPNLKPILSDQTDLGFEWYFDKDAILSSNIFYKDIKNITFIKNYPSVIPNPDEFYQTLVNGPGPSIAGVEIQWQQNLPWGFGINANYTHTNISKSFYFESIPQFFIGSAKEQVNSSIYYENQKISARLSYNYRSKSYGEVARFTQDVNASFTQWDFDVSWSINDRLSLSVEGVNIFNEVVRTRTQTHIPKQMYEYGSRYTLGLLYTLR